MMEGSGQEAGRRAFWEGQARSEGQGHEHGPLWGRQEGQCGGPGTVKDTRWDLVIGRRSRGQIPQVLGTSGRL